MAQRGEIQCAESQFALQSGRRRKCEKFQVGRHLAEEAQPRLPLFVFPTRPISQPPSRHEERLSHILDSCLAVQRHTERGQVLSSDCESTTMGVRITDMERRTSKAFKKWMTNEDIGRSVYDRTYAQGTAEDRVTAVNNEFRRLSLTSNVTVFDANGNVVSDLKALLTHVKAIKAYLDRGHYHEGRNKYGIVCFVDFVKWLTKKPHLNTFENVCAYLDGAGLVATALPCGTVFRAYLLNKYGRMTDNVRSIWSRVHRVLCVVPHTHGHPTFEELSAMIRNMRNYVGNVKSAEDCATAIRHYMRAIYGRTEN